VELQTVFIAKSLQLRVSGLTDRRAVIATVDELVLEVLLFLSLGGEQRLQVLDTSAGIPTGILQRSRINIKMSEHWMRQAGSRPNLSRKLYMGSCDEGSWNESALFTGGTMFPLSFCSHQYIGTEVA
jgi:hypothetical protein